MAKFSLARQPYYIAVIIYMVFVALISFFQNSQAVGAVSDFYLVMIALSAGLAGLSFLYLTVLQAGGDDDSDAAVAGLQFGKSGFYIAVLGVCVYRAVIGYLMNHNDTGIDSTYGVVWLFASLALMLFTWANYRSYAAAHPAIAPSSTGSSNTARHI